MVPIPTLRYIGPMLLSLVLALALCMSLVFGTPFKSQFNNHTNIVNGTVRNNGIHLAIGPTCGSLDGDFANVNSGLLDIASYKTIVSFGDSYTDTGGNRDGNPPPPAVVIPPNPLAGGRSTNGLVWLENFALDHGNITVMNYAVSAAVTNASLWPSKANNSDFVHQADLFLSQSHKLDPATTLFVVFFGINDYQAAQIDGNHLPEAARSLLNEIDLLASAPTNARNFLVLDGHGIGAQSADGDAYKQAVFSGINARRKSSLSPQFRAGFVDFASMWSSITDNKPPGFSAFGYKTNSYCYTGPTFMDHCADPDHTWYWIASHPAKEGMRLMADFVNEALARCRTS